MDMVCQESGESNQRRRTRAGILAAAIQLLGQGQSPTVAEVADAAAVSRATAYRYFPSQEYLVQEAALNGFGSEVYDTLAAPGPSSDLASLSGLSLRSGMASMNRHGSD